MKVIINGVSVPMNDTTLYRWFSDLYNSTEPFTIERTKLYGDVNVVVEEES